MPRPLRSPAPVPAPPLTPTVDCPTLAVGKGQAGKGAWEGRRLEEGDRVRLTKTTPMLGEYRMTAEQENGSKKVIQNRVGTCEARKLR